MTSIICFHDGLVTLCFRNSNKLYILWQGLFYFLYILFDIHCFLQNLLLIIFLIFVNRYSVSQLRFYIGCFWWHGKSFVGYIFYFFCCHWQQSEPHFIFARVYHRLYIGHIIFSMSIFYTRVVANIVYT